MGLILLRGGRAEESKRSRSAKHSLSWSHLKTDTMPLSHAHITSVFANSFQFDKEEFLFSTGGVSSKIVTHEAEVVFRVIRLKSNRSLRANCLFFSHLESAKTGNEWMFTLGDTFPQIAAKVEQWNKRRHKSHLWNSLESHLPLVTIIGCKLTSPQRKRNK